MKLRRLSLVVALLGTAIFWATSATSAPSVAPSGQPLYQFLNTGAQPLPWNAVSLQSQLQGTTMAGGPHGALGSSGGVITYRTTSGDVAELSVTNAGSSSWRDLTTRNNVPPAGSDPVPFYDPYGNVDVLYVDQSSHLILLSPNDPFTPWWPHLHDDRPWSPLATTDLTRLTGVTAAAGVPSVEVAAAQGTVAFRSTGNAVEVLRLTWNASSPLPIYSGVDETLSPPPASQFAPPPPSTTTTTTTPGAPSSSTSTTTTTTPATTSTGPTFASDPVVLPGLVGAVAVTLNNGAVLVYVNSGPSFTTWSPQSISQETAAARAAGPLSVASTSSFVDIAALSTSGAVELFSAPLSNDVTASAPSTATTTSPPNVVVASLPSSPALWNLSNVTALASGAPPLAGTLALNITPTQTTIAGQASDWGDLFVLTNVSGASSWTSTDVSVTAGTAARTVGNVVAGLTINNALTLYAAGLASPPPQGVGVYAIPSSKWSQSITDGWPIVSETGGLGTQSSPWVGFTGSSNVAYSPDFLLGQTIYNSHKRVTWLSFWTVSGPLANEPQTLATYYRHGFSAGAWVATQIDSYRALGVGLKPDWVIFDPEGYPDNHSHLDAPAGSTAAVMNQYAAYWSAMLRGWANGLASVDPTLNPGVYASQSEYRNYHLASSSLPVFMAVAFAGGGPVPIGGATGANIRGYISFGASCTPASTLAREEQTLLNPPWSGQFNTLQFNYGVYCPPLPL